MATGKEGVLAALAFDLFLVLVALVFRFQSRRAEGGKPWIGIREFCAVVFVTAATSAVQHLLRVPTPRPPNWAWAESVSDDTLYSIAAIAWVSLGALAEFTVIRGSSSSAPSLATQDRGIQRLLMVACPLAMFHALTHANVAQIILVCGFGFVLHTLVWRGIVASAGGYDDRLRGAMFAYEILESAAPGALQRQARFPMLGCLLGLVFLFWIAAPIIYAKSFGVTGPNLIVVALMLFGGPLFDTVQSIVRSATIVEGANTASQVRAVALSHLIWDVLISSAALAATLGLVFFGLQDWNGTFLLLVFGLTGGPVIAFATWQFSSATARSRYRDDGFAQRAEYVIEQIEISRSADTTASVFLQDAREQADAIMVAIMEARPLFTEALALSEDMPLAPGRAATLVNEVRSKTASDSPIRHMGPVLSPLFSAQGGDPRYAIFFMVREAHYQTQDGKVPAALVPELRARERRIKAALNAAIGTQRRTALLSAIQALVLIITGAASDWTKTQIQRAMDFALEWQSPRE